MPSQSSGFVKFENIDKSYDGKVLVVENLNLDIAKGEFLTLLGPSGSGKTTTLMMLAGFENPTHGEIYLESTPISNITPHKRGIGMVFQNYALFPHLTVFENLAFPLNVRKYSKEDAKKKVEKALNMVEKTSIVEGEKLRSEELISEVHDKSERIVLEAQQKSSKLLEESVNLAKDRRDGADNYAREILFALEERIVTILGQVRSGLDLLDEESENISVEENK